MSDSRPQPTLIDYVAIAISPALIILLVGSLAFFLLMVFYAGAYEGRLFWTTGCFVFAAVLISRVSIVEGAERASMFGIALGVVAGLAMMRFTNHPWWAWLVLGIIWWCASHLVWNCTLVDDEDDASGEGLLEAAGFDAALSTADAAPPKPDPRPSSAARRKKREEAKREEVSASAKAPSASPQSWIKRAYAWWQRSASRKAPPGLTLIYFSLAALPLFGLGQHFVPSDERLYAFQCLLIYVASALGLLITTSFLGLRRYLRQRRLEMPLEMAGTWLGMGAVLAGVVILMAMLIPRPQPEYTISSVTGMLSSPPRDASSYAPLHNSPGQGESNSSAAPNDQTTPKDPTSPENQTPSNNQTAPSDSSSSGSASNGSQPQSESDPDAQSAQSPKGEQTPAGQQNSGGQSQQGAQSQQSEQSQQGEGSPSGSQGEQGQQGQGTSSQQGDSQSKSGSPSEKQQTGSQGQQQSSPSSQDQQNQQQQSRSQGDQQGSQATGAQQQKQPDQQQSRQQSDDQQQQGQQQDQQPGDEKRQSDQQASQNQEQDSSSSRKSGEKQSEKQSSQDESKSRDAMTSKMAQDLAKHHQQSPTLRPPPLGTMAGLLWLLKMLVYAAIALALVYGLIRYWANVLAFLVAAWKELMALWSSIFGRRAQTTAEDADASAPRKTTRPFSTFADPFASGAAARNPPHAIVQYSFEALEAWAADHDAARVAEETPLEFAARLASDHPPLAEGVQELASLYARVAYARQSLAGEKLDSVKRLWIVLRNTAAPTVTA
jgi:hypothetical protein